jgi:hypothetical protein
MTTSFENFSKGIADAFETERRGTRKAANPYDIPRSYDDIEPEWFTHILCRNYPDAKVIDFRAEEPDDLDRGHMRVWLTYNESGQAAGLPASVFCKDSQNLTMRMTNTGIGMQSTEVEFYRHARHLFDNALPVCLWANYSPYSHNSIVVFEDLMHEGAEFCTGEQSISRDQIEQQLAYLARIHSKFYGDQLHQYPVLEKRQTYYDLFNRVCDLWSLEERANKGFLGAESVIPSSVFERYDEIWPLTVKAAEMHDSSGSNTIIQGDAHLRNWYILPSGEMRLGDWQLISRADFSVELNYALVTSLSVENRRAWRDDLLRFYIEKMEEGGVRGLSFDDVEKSTCRQLLIALPWWTCAIKTDGGSTVYQPQKETLEMIRRISIAIEDLDALERFG